MSIVSGNKLNYFIKTYFNPHIKKLADLKAHAFSNPVANLTTTAQGVSLDATMGKALDDKIGAVNDALEYSDYYIPIEAGDSRLQSVLDVAFDASKPMNLNKPYRLHQFSVASGKGPQFTDLPDAIAEKEMVVFRTVLIGSNLQRMVRLEELHPVPGRIWYNAYNVKWQGWVNIAASANVNYLTSKVFTDFKLLQSNASIASNNSLLINNTLHLNLFVTFNSKIVADANNSKLYPVFQLTNRVALARADFLGINPNTGGVYTFNMPVGSGRAVSNGRAPADISNFTMFFTGTMILK